MIKIDNATAKATRDAIDAAGTEGWWTNGDPGGGIPATIIEADWLNDLQAILRAVIDGGSVTPTKGPGGDNDLLTAINVLIGLGLPQGTLVGRLDRDTASIIKLLPSNGTNVICGIDNAVLTNAGSISFDLSAAEGGESASTPYYLYLRNLAGALDPQVSTTAPDLPGGTKPGYKSGDVTRRCVGSTWNNAAQDIVPCSWGPGGEVRFHQHDADHEYDLTPLTKSTSWREQAINLPVTADVALCHANVIMTTGDGMAVYGIEGATGILTDVETDPRVAAGAGFAYAIAASTHSGSSNKKGSSVSFEAPIITPAAPKVAWGLTDTADSNHILLVTGYRDLFAPR